MTKNAETSGRETDGATDPSAPPSLAAQLFSIDPRALAALRVALALILLIDLFLRSLEFDTFYTDSGILPFRVPLNHVVPLHALSGAPWYQATLFVVAALFASLMLVGRFTRVATVGSWAMLVSLQTQNSITCYFGDEILRAVLFWCMFVPLGAVWSMDAQRRPVEASSLRKPIVSIGTAALLLQIASVYFFSGILKSGPDWRQTGLAIPIALHRDWLVQPFGLFLSEHFSGLLRVTTFLVLGFEIGGPLVLFSPVWTARLRVAMVSASWFFQLLLGLSLFLGLMPWINSLMMLAFLPPFVWNALEHHSPWLKAHVGSTASFKGAPSERRPRFASFASLARTLGQATAAVLLAYVLAFNVVGLRDDWHFPETLGKVGQWLRINQRWAMFSPVSPREDGWYVIPGVLADGRMVNLWWTGPKLSWEKPKLISSYHPSRRWSTYEMRLTEPLFDRPEYSHFRRRYAEWHCERWNRTHFGGERVVRLDVLFADERTRDDLAPVKPTLRRLASVTCSDGTEESDGQKTTGSSAVQPAQSSRPEP